jgi:arabinogalactan endo-1,4-beta-galactosidase
MKIASILSIVALIASMATNGCSEDGPVTNPRQEEPQKVVKEEGFGIDSLLEWRRTFGA